MNKRLFIHIFYILILMMMFQIVPRHLLSVVDVWKNGNNVFCKVLNGPIQLKELENFIFGMKSKNNLPEVRTLASN